MCNLEYKAVVSRLHRLSASITQVSRLHRAFLGKIGGGRPCPRSACGCMSTSAAMMKPQCSHLSSTPRWACQAQVLVELCLKSLLTALVRLSSHSCRRGGLLCKLPTKAKLFQMRSMYGMLLQVCDLTYFLFSETLNPLKAISNTSAPLLHQCLCQTSGVTMASCDFQMPVRSVVADQAASNLACEASLAALRGAPWTSFHIHCDTHRIAICFKRSMEGIMGQDVSSMIKCAISLREAGKFVIFKQALLEELRSRELVIVEGPLSQPAAAHRQLLMEILLQRQINKDPVGKMVMVESTFTGDWRKPCLEYVIPVGTPVPSRSKVRQLMETVALSILTSTQPSIYPRHRWTGAEESISWFPLPGCPSQPPPAKLPEVPGKDQPY